MTFSEIKQAVYDLLGLTSETTMVARFVNEAKDELVGAKEWWWNEWSATQSLASTTRSYTLTTDAEAVRELLTASDGQIEFCDRETYRDLYRYSTATAGFPYVYTIEGSNTDGGITINVWPKPSAASVMTVRYARRIPDVSTDGSTFQHMPATFHFALVKGAAARFRDWEQNFEAAQALKNDFQKSIEELYAKHLGGIVQ